MRTMLASVLVGGVVLAAGATAVAGPPTDQLRHYTDEVLKILDDPALKGTEKSADRRAAVRKLAIEIFDVAETAKRALGRHWQARSGAEREEFTRLFSELLERTYISRIDLYGGERIRYVGEAIDGDAAIVRSRVITRQGTEIPVESRLLRRGDRWLIYDLVIENISLVGNYRAQFDAIIQKTSFGDLVRRLKERQDDFIKPAPTVPRRTAS